jgi:hydroxyacylglutathione hydrolase
MALKVHRLPAFTDNYFWIIESDAASVTKQVAVVDPGDAAPIIAWLEANDCELTTILLTHHHADHVGGALALRDWAFERGAEIRLMGPEHDASKIGFAYERLNDGQKISVLGAEATILHIPGHTLGHIAYYFAGEHRLFCGDTLFAMGCGRVFEGTHDQMWHSLSRLNALPDSTIVYCAHEYTASNCKFAMSEEPSNLEVIARTEKVSASRAVGEATVPFLLGEDKASNPFLRASREQFAALRQRKDVFR